MAGIIGLTDILRSDFSSFSPEEVGNILDDLHRCSLRLNRTLRNYLLILDLQSTPAEPLLGALSPRQVEVSIHAGVDEVLRMIERKEDVTVEVNSCSISTKPGDLTRIVEELVDNACKFSRQGTPVIVELDSDGRLIVTDEGRGLTVEEINHIGAFQQFDRKKHEQQGLGLGLVLVQNLAASSGAKFLITSQPGEGTKVEIAFPSVIQPDLERADADHEFLIPH
jgi:two-component system sensor histidine kinase/response regulator